MSKVLNLLGNVAALFGVLLCLVAGLARLAGAFHLGGYQTLTVFQAGVAAMVFACLAKLQQTTMK